MIDLILIGDPNSDDETVCFMASPPIPRVGETVSYESRASNGKYTLSVYGSVKSVYHFYDSVDGRGLGHTHTVHVVLDTDKDYLWKKVLDFDSP